MLHYHTSFSGKFRKEGMEYENCGTSSYNVIKIKILTEVKLILLHRKQQRHHGRILRAKRPICRQDRFSNTSQSEAKMLMMRWAVIFR